MQSGPGIFKGDHFFYWQDGDFDDRSANINTLRCPVYLLSGEYDNSCTPERATVNHELILGSKLTIIKKTRHFPMSESPDLFRTYLLPILDEISEEQMI